MRPLHFSRNCAQVQPQFVTIPTMSPLSALVLLLITLGAVAIADPLHRKVKLADVTSITLRKGAMTTGRRSDPVPQLVCVDGGSVGCSMAGHPPMVQCHSTGFNGVDVEWECKADLDSLHQFGHVEVTCEGFDYAEDPFVLAGSCGLEYSLNFVPGASGGTTATGQGAADKPPPPELKEWLMWFFIFVLIFLLYSIYKAYLEVAADHHYGDDRAGAFWTGVGITALAGVVWKNWTSGGGSGEGDKKNEVAKAPEKKADPSPVAAAAPEPSGVLVTKSGFGATKRR